MIEHMFPSEIAPADGTAADVAPVDPQTELERLGIEGREVAARIAADQARLVELAVRVEELKGSLTARFPGTWMGWQWGMSNGEVRRVRLLAEKLPALPGISAAFAAGQVSEATALAMSRVATPDNESELLELADTATAAQLQVLLRRYDTTVSPKPDAEAPDPVGPNRSTSASPTSTTKACSTATSASPASAARRSPPPCRPCSSSSAMPLPTPR